MSNILAEARRYLERGLSVIPLRPRAKRPAMKWVKYQRNRATEADLREWFQDGTRNIGIVCGPVSGGLIVRDFDQAGAYDRWKDRNPVLSRELPTVSTARGAHVYARAESTITACLDDGEVRGTGAYVVAPYSIHPSGTVYRWLVPLADEIPMIDPLGAGFAPSLNTGCSVSSMFSVLSDGPSVFSVLSRDSSIEGIIRRTLPSGPGHRYRAIFNLARELRAVPECANEADQLRSIVIEWHRQALPFIRTKELDTTWNEFLDAFAKVKYPAGTEPIGESFAAAAARASLPQCTDRYDTAGIKVLIAWCAELQRRSGEKPFYLDCRTAGTYLGTSHVTAWKWLHWLCRDDVLELVSIGTAKSHRASEYRFTGG